VETSTGAASTENSMEVPQKKEKVEPPYNPAVSLGYICKESQTLC